MPRSRQRRKYGQPHNSRGMVLLLALWIMAILVLLSLGLGRRARIDVNLTKQRLAKIRSKYAAYAGFFYGQELIRNDVVKNRAADDDAAGDPQKIYKGIEAGGGLFDLVARIAPESAADTYGIIGEASRINITALNQDNYQIFRYLLQELGVEEDRATIIASSTVDWIDQDTSLFNEPFGAEEKYYLAATAQYLPRNAPFTTVQELLLVRGMDEELLTRLEPYITIYPPGGLLRVNLQTASRLVIKATALSCSGAKTNTSVEDAESLIEKMVEYRNGADGIYGTADDLPYDPNEMWLNAKETAILQTMTQYNITEPAYFRVGVIGYDTDSRVSTRITAVVNKDDLSIVSWYRE